MADSCLAPRPPIREMSYGNTNTDGSKHVMEFSYLWTIDNLTTIIDEVDVIKSPVISPAYSNELKWSLRLFPYGVNTDTGAEDVSLYLYLEPCNISKVRAQYLFSIVDSNRKKIISRGIKEPCIFEYGKEKPGHGFRKYTEYNLLTENLPHGLLVNHNLTIFCEIKVFNNKVERKVVPCEVPDSRLVEDVELLFETQQYTDFKILVNDKEFSVHRAILSARSSVFSAMFEHDMKERKENSVRITDMNSGVLREMLRFIYTDKVENIEKIAEQLIVAADKYALERLKSMCEEALCASLEVENAADILILADVHSAEQLKTRTIEFITERNITTDVMATTGFASMTTSHPQLLAEILRAMAAKRN